MFSIEEKLKEIGLEMQPYWSTQYLKNVEKLSKPEYQIKEEKDIQVPMRDGVKLCVDVYRPNGEGKFPTLIAWCSYGKMAQTSRFPLPRSRDSVGFTMMETGDIEFFVRRGYAFLVPDPRGCGFSEGEWNGLYSPQEQKDCYDVIEWCAEQPWSNGNVGMTGLSYYGQIQPLVASLNPPHLKAIMPIPTCDDFYYRAYNGGIISMFYYGFDASCCVNNGVAESESLYTEEELKWKMKERLKDPEIRSHPGLINTLECWPVSRHTFMLDILLHPLDGPFWARRSEKTIRDKIKIPSASYGYQIGGSDFRVASNFKSFADPKLSVPKKVGVVGIQYMTPFRFFREEVLRWYDHWLKGVDTGIMDEPPVRIFVMGVNRYRFEKEWPIARTQWMTLNLLRYRKLDFQECEDAGIPPDIFSHDPAEILEAKDQQWLTYSTEPLTKPLEVTGHGVLDLYAAIDVKDAHFIVKLWDAVGIPPNSQKIRLVTQGFLKASHRMIKENLEQFLSKPYVPLVDHTKSVPINPGEIAEYLIELNAMSNVFQPGHRLELEIKSMDLVRGRLGTRDISHIPSPKQTVYKIYRDAEYPSHLLLPVIPDTPKELWIETPEETPFYQYKRQ